jgi:two-component system, NarL family, nitrate/nitrite response regulator NarL
VPRGNRGGDAGLRRDWRVTNVARLVLGDDHVVFLDALSTVLTQHGYEISPVARSAPEMVALVRRDRPDVCVIDRSAVLDDDVKTIGRVRAASDITSVLVLSPNPDSEAVARALDAGASGYLHQSRGVGELVCALERVLRGEIVVDVPDAQPPSRRSAEPNQGLRMAGHLTSRERECLLMLVEGLDTAAIMAKLNVSRTTVRTHLQAVLTKLGVHSRLEAVSFAVRHRLPDLWSSTESVPAPASTVRQMRPRRAPGLSVVASDQPLAVAAGQGVGPA